MEEAREAVDYLQFKFDMEDLRFFFELKYIK